MTCSSNDLEMNPLVSFFIICIIIFAHDIFELNWFKSIYWEFIRNIPALYWNNTSILVCYFWNTLYNTFAMIKVVFHNKNALNSTVALTLILWLTNIFYINQQNHYNAMYNLWLKTSTNVRYILHAAVLLFAQLHCMVKPKYSKFVSLRIHTFFSLKPRNFHVLFLLHYLGSWMVKLWHNNKTICSVYTHC